MINEISSQEEKKLIDELYKDYGIIKREMIKLDIEVLESIQDKSITNQKYVDLQSKVIDYSLSGKERSLLKLKECCIVGGGFRKLNCEDALFVNCEFSDSNFIDSDLRNAKFFMCSFKDVKFTNMQLDNAVFIDCTFTECKMTSSSLEDVKWLKTNYRDAGIVDDSKSFNKCNTNSMVAVKAKDQVGLSEVVDTTKPITLMQLSPTIIKDKLFKDETIEIQDMILMNFIDCRFENVVFNDAQEFGHDYAIDLRLDLNRCTFLDCHFKCKALTKCYLTECNFENTGLSTSFIKCVFNKVKFENVEVSRESIFNYSVFADCDLGEWRYKDHDQAKMKGTWFSGNCADDQEIIALKNQLFEKSKEIELANQENIKLIEKNRELKSHKDNEYSGKKLASKILGILIENDDKLIDQFIPEVEEAKFDDGMAIDYLSKLDEVTRSKLFAATFIRKEEPSESMSQVQYEKGVDNQYLNEEEI